MLKRFVLNRRKRELDVEAFRHYWRNIHGPLLASLPAYRDFVTRYDQNHVLAPGLIGKPFDYDGLTEIWQRSEDNIKLGFATTDVYRETVQPDEVHFADREKTVAFFADQRTAAPAQTPVKLIILTTRRAGLTPSEFHEHLWNVERPRLQQTRAFWNSVRGYQQNHVRAGSGRGLAGAATDVPDDLSTFWFDSLDDAHAACIAAGALLYASPEIFATDLTRSFFAEAVTFFDERPCT